MSRRSRKHKKRFACGHRGFGRYCHRCAEQASHRQNRLMVKQENLRERQLQRQQWQDTFATDEIQLNHLPKAIVKKARRVLAQLEQGHEYWQLAGKRLKVVREVIRIPVTHRYRLLCHDDGDRITPIKVVSHETYNNLYGNAKRLISSVFAKRSSST